MAGKKTVAEARFWACVRFAETNDGCWLWCGSLSPNGYGRFWDGERDTYAHIYSWLLHFGSLPEHLPQVTHRCNKPACVRPSHLVPATQKQNLEYMVACGRDSKYWLGKTFSPAHLAKLGHKGEANPAYRHDLPDATVLAEMYRKAGSVTAVARTLDCSHHAVARRLKTVSVRLRTLSEIASERTGSKNPFFGRRHSPASLRKMSKSHQRRCQD